MLGAKVSVTYDIGGDVAEEYRQMRDELLAAVTDGKIKGYFGACGGLNVRAIAGTLIEVKFGGFDESGGKWLSLAGFKTRMVHVEDEGTEHFPAAGIYRGQPGSHEGAAATVRWKSVTEYPAREDLLEGYVRASAEDHVMGLTLKVPVVSKRSWELVLTAPSLETATQAYDDLRGGYWKPTTPFVDALPETAKLRQVPLRMEPGEYGQD